MADFYYQGRIYYNPIELTMAFIGGTWKMPILTSLRNHPLRYKDLKNSIPHSTDKMLYSELRDLQKKGLIERKAYREKPPRVDYGLTALGQQTIAVIDTLNDFGKFLMKHEKVRLVGAGEEVKEETKSE